MGVFVEKDYRVKRKSPKMVVSLHLLIKLKTVVKITKKCAGKINRKGQARRWL